MAKLRTELAVVRAQVESLYVARAHNRGVFTPLQELIYADLVAREQELLGAIARA